MKISRTLLICILTFFICIRANSQKSVTIKFDLSTKTILNPADLATIKTGDFLSVQLVNFNPYLYQAQIAFADSTIAINSPSSLFSSLFNTSSLTSLLGNLGSTALQIFPGKAAMLAPGGARPILTRADSIAIMAHFIIDQKTALGSRQQDLTNLIQTMQTYIFDQDVKSFIVQKWNLKATDITDFTSTEQAQFITSVKGFFTTENTIRQDAMNAINNYETNQLIYSKYIKEDSLLHSADSIITVSNKILLQSIASFDETFSYSKFETVLQKLINLQQDNFQYTSFPTQIKADITNINISMTPWNSNSNLSSYKASWQFPIAPKSYFNFSSDLYVSGLHDENYYAVQKITSSHDTTYAISKSSGNTFEVGIAALFHYGWYLGKNGSNNTSFQLSFGPGLSIQKSPLLRLIAGVGLGFGKKNKILFNTGVIVGEVQRLEDYYQSNPIVPFSPTNLTTSVLKANVFFSFGYVLF